METISKSIKIKVSLSIIWVVLAMFVAGGAADSYSGFKFSVFLGVTAILSLPLLLYWLGFWIWGDGYIRRIVLWPFSKFKKIRNSTSVEPLAIVPQSQTQASYIVRHWRGELPLVTSYWVNCFLLSIAINIFLSVVISEVDFGKSYRIAIWITVLFLSVWQLVGTWRSATNYSVHTNKKWGGLVKIAIVFGIMQLANTAHNKAIPQITEYWQIATDNDRLGNYQFRVLRDASELELSGHLGFGVTNETKKYLDAHPTIKIIHLNSEGGRIIEAKKLATLIEVKKLSTYTSSGCYSACILAYAAGERRLIDRNASLGFHQYSFPGAQQIDFLSAYEEDKKYLLSKGIQPNFVAKIFSTPNERLWKPSHQELFQSRFVTGYPDIDAVAFSGMKLSDLHKINAEFLKIPLYAAIKEVDPSTYDKLNNSIRSGVERGESIAEMRSAIGPFIQKIVFQRLPKTSDVALLSFTSLLVEQLVTIRKTNPVQCYEYAFGKTSDSFDGNKYFSKEMVGREMQITADVIRGYSANKAIPKERDVTKTLESVFVSMSEANRDGVSLLSKNDLSTEEQIKGCSIAIELYRVILRLPQSESAPVLRYLYSEI